MPRRILTVIRYVYLDVVAFTYERSVEAQVYIISALNNIVKKAARKIVPRNSAIYIPVGDGICIALFGDGVDYESHICIALDILAQLNTHNQSVEGACKFQVRIGINQNDDNIITDINGRTNVIGAGVNITQRIMNFADGNQILISRSVYDSLAYREKYMGKFRAYTARAKHNVLLNLFQYIDEINTGINNGTPSAFIIKEEKEPALSKVAAYYFAHCLKNRKFILDKRASGQDNYALKLLFYYLAKDSVGESESTLADSYDPEIIKTKHGTLDEQFDAYMKLDFVICVDLGNLAFEKDIGTGFYRYFEDRWEGLLVNDLGKKKLNSEWSEIWKKFDLDNSN